MKPAANPNQPKSELQQVNEAYTKDNVPSDIKIMFLDQHSMRIGQDLFYTLERSRQVYLNAVEVHPLMSFCTAVALFIGFAIKTPMHRNLMRELGYSVVGGFGICYTYPYYHYKQYLKKVDEVFDIVTEEFEKRPALMERLRRSDDKNAAMLKNFGMSNSNDNDIEDDVDGTTENSLNIFDGGDE